MSAWLPGIALVASLCLALSCEPAPNAGSVSSPIESRAQSSSRASPSLTPAPSTTPSPDEERRISDALASAGVRVGRVYPSKFDWLFGRAAPKTGTFETTSSDGTQAWADIHFLAAPVAGITACAGRSPSGESIFTVSVNGRPQSIGNVVTGALSSGTMYFAASDRYFVMTPDERLRDTLQSAFGLSIPPC